jgi:hypothetical protein
MDMLWTALRRRSGRLLLAGTFVAVFVFIELTLHDFLAVNRPLGQDILVVEAWLRKEWLAQVPSALKSGHYRYLVVVGPPAEISDETSSADVAGSELEKFGCDPSIIVKIRVPFQSTVRSFAIPFVVPPYCFFFLSFQVSRRTYADALAVSEWLKSSRIPTQGVDVFTVSVHARKSWNFFQHAIGDKCPVGVIAVPETLYNPRYWLFSREGIWLVPYNLIGYLYAKSIFLFGE